MFGGFSDADDGLDENAHCLAQFGVGEKVDEKENPGSAKACTR
jgi:hypothetical protein